VSGPRTQGVWGCGSVSGPKRVGSVSAPKRVGPWSKPKGLRFGSVTAPKVVGGWVGVWTPNPRWLGVGVRVRNQTG